MLRSARWETVPCTVHWHPLQWFQQLRNMVRCHLPWLLTHCRRQGHPRAAVRAACLHPPHLSPALPCHAYDRAFWTVKCQCHCFPICKPHCSQDQKFKEGGTLIDNSKLRRVSIDVAPTERPCLM